MTSVPLTAKEGRAVAVLLVQVQSTVIPTLRSLGYFESAALLAEYTRAVVDDPSAAEAVDVARRMGFSTEASGATDPPEACTPQRIAAVHTLVNDLLTSDQSTTVTDLIDDLVQERNAGLIAFATLVEASEDLRRVLDSDTPPTDEDAGVVIRFTGLLDDARRLP